MSSRKLKADPLLNTRMKRHIKALDLSTTEEYQSWCSKHGFQSRLSKNLSQLEEELKTQSRQKRDASVDKGLRNHLKELGFSTIDEYRHWCRENGLGDGLQKSTAQRRKEISKKTLIDFAAEEAERKSTPKNAVDVAKHIASGTLTPEDLTHPGLIAIAYILNENADAKEAVTLFIRLLSAVQKHGDFLATEPVIQKFGRARTNTIVGGLFALAAQGEHWIRVPESWNPKHKSLWGRFGELARHLLATYDVPGFMDSAWFSPSAVAARHQEWFIHIGLGGNIRTAGLPLRFTKKMAHTFIAAPGNFTVIEALRWGQIITLGGTEELVSQINATELGSRLEHEEFWESVVFFFVNNPMLDLSYVGPIIDYIEHRKFLPIEALHPDGSTEHGEPPDPGFSMKGRKADPMIELVDEWHARLSREKQSRSGNWAASGYPGYEHVEEDLESGHVITWNLEELLTRKAVFDEGKAMKHCVRSYVQSCAKGIKSVWSLTRHDTDSGRTRRVLTIALKNDTRVVVQARGKCNAMAGIPPNSKRESQILRREEQLLANGRRIMKMWGDENDITVPRYT